MRGSACSVSTSCGRTSWQLFVLLEAHPRNSPGEPTALPFFATPAMPGYMSVLGTQCSLLPTSVQCPIAYKPRNSDEFSRPLDTYIDRALLSVVRAMATTSILSFSQHGFLQLL